MKLRFAPRALSEAKRIKSWWRANRPAGPDLFDEEMAAAVTLIRGTPKIGAPYLAAVGAPVRRLLLPKTQNYVYYTVGEREIVVLSVWGTPKGSGPKL